MKTILKNKRSVILITAALLALMTAFVIPQFLMDDVQVERSDIDHATTSDHDAEAHSHTLIETAPDLPIPAVSLSISPADSQAYLLEITLENFTLMLENLEGENVNNEGHAHLYLNGEKIVPLFENRYLISHALLQSGENLIVVGLNSNDHSDWANAGKLILGGILLDTTTNKTSPLTELVYTLSWNTEGVDIGVESLSLTNDLGYQIELFSGEIATYSTELVTCTAQTNSLVAWASAIFFPQSAKAGHGGDDPDQSKSTQIMVESLLNPQPIILDQLFIKEADYCNLHYLVGPGIGAENQSIVLAGTYTAPDSTEAIAFEISSTFGWGGFTALENLTLDGGTTHITVERTLGSLFDTIDFETMDNEAMAMAVLRNMMNISLEIQ